MITQREFRLVVVAMVMSMVMVDDVNTNPLEPAVVVEGVECADAQQLTEELESQAAETSRLQQSLTEHQSLTDRLDQGLESSIQSLQDIVQALREWRHAEEVNECVEGTHECHPFAVCSNTRHGYQCTCKTGYQGDGHTSCTRKCPNDGFSVGRKCFSLSDFDDMKSIDDAAEACRDLGGALAEPEDPAQLFIEIRDALGGDAALLGWTDRDREGRWVGLSGRPFLHSDLWAYDEPNDAGGEDCIEVLHDRFNDFDCYRAMRYVCEF